MYETVSLATGRQAHSALPELRWGRCHAHRSRFLRAAAYIFYEGCDSHLEPLTGVEPALSAWKANVLPLDDSGRGCRACPFARLLWRMSDHSFIEVQEELRVAPLWSRWSESNRRPADYKAAALPTELRRHGSHCTGPNPCSTSRLFRAVKQTEGCFPHARRGGAGRGCTCHAYYVPHDARRGARALLI